MASIPLTPASPAADLATPDPAGHFTNIYAAASIDAIVDRFNLCMRYLLNFNVPFERAIQRLCRIELGFDDAVVGFNDMEEAFNWLEDSLEGMTEMLKEVFRATGEILDGMDKTYDGMTEEICALEEKVKQIEEEIFELIHGNGLWPIRICNHRCSLDDPLVWPPVSDTPYPAGKPETLAGLQTMNAEMCAALAAALHLRPPPDLLQSPLEWRRKQVINYIGCAE
ncbi:uncharacterized protein F5891DRAFT_326765 [Suillus fuscotomentosus]|uniref:Uncharacterized protein n=1 Tax=Suillus fuscotomentosus TaxID=1912939 RepID=A0AAD4E648_9AGAM|nr:uncharacterized protein F5891DRAFT_326765 [Suillus fuscotomentosus]KAG1900277.1 hypothetical protein F5891DRAFT_326765 [Suillus fuscotomentosus]